MKTLTVNIPNTVMERIEKLAAEQGGPNYISVNSDEVRGLDALLTDLLMLGLDELDVGESQFPDDVENE